MAFSHIITCGLGSDYIADCKFITDLYDRPDETFFKKLVDVEASAESVLLIVHSLHAGTIFRSAVGLRLISRASIIILAQIYQDFLVDMPPISS